MTTVQTTTNEFFLEYLTPSGWTQSSLGPCKSIQEAWERGKKIGYGFGTHASLARIRRQDTVVTTSVSEEIILIGDMGRDKRSKSRVTKVRRWRKPEGVEK